MIIPGMLSLSQQEAGRRNYNKFNFVNGLSYICLGETIIILFAIRLGCPDYCIAILGSMMFFSNFCMPLGKLMMARYGAVRTISLCWLMRNISILVVAAAPLFTWLGMPLGATLTIIGGVFAFYACRSIGIIGMQPVMGEITTTENRGKFTSRTSGFFYMANLIMLVVIMVVMSWSRDIWVFIASIVTGAVLGFISTWFVSRIDETEAIRVSAGKPVLADMLLTLRDSMRLRMLCASCVISSGIALTVPISMLALKRGYGIDDSHALFFALAQLFGAVATSYLISLLAEETGPRPLAILFYCLMIVLCLLWVIGPDTFKWYYMVWLFILAGAAIIGTGVSMTHYYLTAIPKKEMVATSLTMYIISGVTAGLIGSFVGGGILKYLNTLGMAPVEMFKLYFLIATLLLLPGLILVSRLKPLADWNVSEVLSLAFAPKDIITLFNLYSIKQVANPREERENIDRLLEIKSGLSEKALLSYLDSPKFSLRGRALNALGEIPFGERTVKAVLDELEDGEYTTANIAAQIAGENGMTEAIPLLRQHLHSGDVYLQAKTMLALTLLHDTGSYPEIKKIFQETANPRLITHGAAALTEIADIESFRLLLDKTAVPDIPRKVLYEVIYSMVHLVGMGDAIYQFLKLYSKDRSKALLHLAELCQQDFDDGERGESDKKLIFEADEGSMPRRELIERLIQAYEHIDVPQARIVADFLRSSSAEQLPLELLLCLIPLKNVIHLRTS